MRKIFSNTFIRYLFSYLLIFVVLMFGFFTIIRNQLTNLYNEQLIVQSQEKLSNMAQRFTDEMNGLEAINVALKADMNVMAASNNNNKYFDYQVYQEMNKFSTGKTFIESIVYYNKQYDILVSPGILTAYADGTIRFLEAPFLNFDYSVYLNRKANQLIYLEEDENGYFIFFPSNSKYDNQLVFFIIDQWEIKQLCKSTASAEIPAIALVDYEKNVITGWNAEMLLPYMDIYEIEDGIYPIDDNNSLCVCKNITTGSFLLAYISNELLLKQVETVFQPVYKVFMVLCGIGLLLVLYSMYCTYFPLKALTRKITPAPSANHNHLNVLEQTFTETSQQNEQMAEKLKQYQISMKKTILDSIMSANQPEGNTVGNIDKFYSMEPDNHIFAVNMQAAESTVDYEKIIAEFEKIFTEETPCIVLEMTENTAIFLLCYSGKASFAQEAFQTLLMEVYEKYGYYSAVSRSSFSPMDIPAMYESVRKASVLWGKRPVVFAEDMEADVASENTMVYPYDTIAELTSALAKNDFDEAQRCVSELFQIVDAFRHSQERISDFFVRYVLSDVLYAIINAMNNCNMKLDSYKDLYLETLYYCRSFPYDEKKEAIKTNIDRLMEQFSEYVKQKYDIDNQLRLLIAENYQNPDISITYIAEYFHISVAYASLLVKRSTGLNFSEYLWELRLARAKELLLTTQEAVDAISIKVGYLNPSSFRRKFKQEVGITPSTYREISGHNKR